MNADDVVRALRADAVPIAAALRLAENGGLPAAPGFYTWWTSRGSIPGVPSHPHPTDAALDLFYVGISPANSSSRQTLRKRVANNHLGGNLGSSTFRLTLAALLLEALDLHPTATATKVVLPKDENDKLSAWQRKHLSLTWCAVQEPWTLEPAVIAAMGPPLNLATNPDNTFGRVLSSKRGTLRAMARSATLTYGSAGVSDP